MRGRRCAISSTTARVQSHVEKRRRDKLSLHSVARPPSFDHLKGDEGVGASVFPPTFRQGDARSPLNGIMISEVGNDSDVTINAGPC